MDKRYLVIFGLFVIVSGAVLFGVWSYLGSNWNGQDDDNSITPVEAPGLTQIGLSFENFPILDGATVTQPIRGLITCSALNIGCAWEENEAREMFVYPQYPQGEPNTPNTKEQIAYNEKIWQLREEKLLNSKTHQAYLNLINGQVDIILVATQPSKDELTEAESKGVGFEIVPIGLDGFIFLVNSRNNIRELTTEQIVDIYSGKVKNWSEVGGHDQEIMPFVRNPNSGSQELMEKLVMKETPIGEFPEELKIDLMGTLVEGVDQYENAVGYSLYYYKNTMIDRRGDQPEVKVVAVDGVDPSPETVSAREYPYTYEIYAVVRTDLDKGSLEYKILQWLTTPDGQKLIREAGFSSLNI